MIYVYTIAKGLTIYFYWDFILKPVLWPRVLGWSLNYSNLPGQADSQHGIATRLAGDWARLAPNMPA